MQALRVAVLLFLLSVFCYSLFSHYNVHLFTSVINFSFWLMGDLDIHLYLAAATMLSAAMQACLDFFQLSVLRKTLGDSNNSTKGCTDVFTSRTTVSDDKMLLYKLLTANLSASQRSSLLPKLFKDNRLFSQRWEGIETPTLFRAAHSSASASSNLPDALTALTSLGWVPKRLTPTSPALMHLNFQPELPQKLKSFSGSSKSRVEYALWNLELLGREAASKGLYVHSADGLIYSTTNYSKASYQSLSDTSAINIQDSLKGQADTVKWGRWLYKYSILHRRLLTHLNKTVSAKGLIGTGFVTSDLTSQNLWAASTLKKNGLDWDKISAAYKEIYGSYVDLATTSTPSSSLPLPTNGITSLTTDAPSYNWFIKRFYGLNTLPVNTVSLAPALTSTRHFTPTLLKAEDSSLRASLSSQNLDEFSVLYATRSSDSECRTTTSSSYYAAYESPSVLQRTNIQTMVSLVRNNGDSGVKFFLLRPFS